MDIKATLETWGNWARCQTGTEYPRVAAGFQDMKSGGQADGVRMCCTDDEGMMVDRAVAELQHYDRQAYKIVIVHYVFRISQHKIARGMDKGQSYVASILRIAEAFIAGQLRNRENIS